MERERIQEFLIKQSKSDYLFAVRLNDYINIVGRFDKKEMIENSANIWKFYLNDDHADERFENKVIEINGDDIFTLDAF